ncbi:hypothetical protein METBIDRAFT_45336 [Metschnikowia bicuspidata var. bicuspidata NRRL YB-4993]|uniref:DUF7702 domain-containing protein n=1 Tax=Metschnikowia bicuspidata var. bicuspidata NRRL YB-4993 TaxID=869754 RepID=A0A1A0H6W2_9ASCO|nr:hypothetical protein METBIDRAFT_45336 [Metschnikowia bicuspidata var. bicuspidata NRRL YB-4993]OBA19834.1 hypothetical protein METBIDRAFT_45336 [Metschnikowia bicuspidata var. bicuspidata NRRL YB-4993]
MSGFDSPASGIAASVYLGLYTIFLIFMIYVLIKRGVKTLFTFIFVFCVFRFAGQLCGVIYAKVGVLYTNWLVAYLVLQAEGYFTLILTCFRITCKAQEDKFRKSWIMESGPRLPIFRQLNSSWMRCFHLILIPANALLIAGGSLTAGVDLSDSSSGLENLNTAKRLRTAGQIIFLFMTAILIGLNMYVFIKERVRNRSTMSVMIAGPFLIIRGIFGVLSIYIDDMNYYELSNYSDTGVNKTLVIYEYVLATTMEFLTAVVLMTRFFSPETVESEHRRGEKVSVSVLSYEGL